MAYFLCHFEQSGANMSPIKIAHQNGIFSPLCLTKAVQNKRKRNKSRMRHFKTELAAGFTTFLLYIISVIT